MASGTAKWLYRHSSQSSCPFNVKFARELADDSPFAPREALGRKDARTLARELSGTTQAEFSAAFRGSPMKRAKLRGLKRNAAVVLGNVGTAADVPVLEQALADPDPLVCEHAAWALARLKEGQTRRAPAGTAVAVAAPEGAPTHAPLIPARGAETPV